MSIATLPVIESSPAAAAPAVETGPVGKATASLVLGILSVVTAAVPLLGLPLSIVGLVLAGKGARSSRAGQARAGLVLSIVGLAITSVVFMIGFASGLAASK
jgi:hypothetical protein